MKTPHNGSALLEKYQPLNFEISMENSKIVIRVNENAIPESLSRYLQIDTFCDGFLVTVQNYKKYGNYSRIEKNTCLCGLIILPDILI